MSARHPLRPLLVAAGLAWSVAAPAWAATSFFDTSASFAGASQGLVSLGFEGIVPAGASVYKPSAVNVGPVSFTSNGNKFVTDKNGGFGDYGVSKLNAQVAPPSALSLQATVADGVTALSFALGSYIGVFGVDVVVNGSDHHAITTPTQAGVATTFVGMTSTVPIRSVTFTTTFNPVNHTVGQYAGLDVTGFQVGRAVVAAVPEAGTSALMLAGLAAMAGLAARRRRRG
jgi:hypothetical protein